MKRTCEDAHQQPWSRRLPAPSLPRPLSPSPPPPPLSVLQQRAVPLVVDRTARRYCDVLYSCAVSNRKYHRCDRRDMGCHVPSLELEKLGGVIAYYRTLSRVIAHYRELSHIIASYRTLSRELSRVIASYRELYRASYRESYRELYRELSSYRELSRAIASYRGTITRPSFSSSRDMCPNSDAPEGMVWDEDIRVK